MYIQEQSTLLAISAMFGISNGICNACIFIWKSSEMRRRWHDYFFLAIDDRQSKEDLDPIPYDFEDDEKYYDADYRHSFESENGSISAKTLSEVASISNPMVFGNNRNTFHVKVDEGGSICKTTKITMKDRSISVPTVSSTLVVNSMTSDRDE